MTKEHPGPQPAAGAAHAPAPPSATLWQRFRARLQGRADSEHEQILVRGAIAVAIVTGLTIAAFGDPPPSEIVRLLLIAGSYLAGSVLLLGHLLVDPGPRPTRRYVGMMLDMLALTLVMLIGDNTSAVFYPFYLWITLGMGFRYGRRYLLVSAVVTLASLAVVIAESPYWHDQPSLAAGLWL